MKGSQGIKPHKKGTLEEWLKNTRMLSQIIAEGMLAEPKKKVVKTHRKKFVSCIKCKSWVTIRKDGENIIGKCTDTSICPSFK